MEIITFLFYAVIALIGLFWSLLPLLIWVEVTALRREVRELRDLLPKPQATSHRIAKQPEQSISIDDRLDRYISQQQAASRQIFHPLPDENPKHRDFLAQ